METDSVFSTRLAKKEDEAELLELKKREDDKKRKRMLKERDLSVKRKL